MNYLFFIMNYFSSPQREVFAHKSTHFFSKTAIFDVKSDEN